MKHFFPLCVMFLFISFSCSKSGTDKGSGSDSFWQQSDGTDNAQLSLTGNIAKICSSGYEMVGSYNASVPSMSFSAGGTNYTYPLKFQGSSLLVGAPNQPFNAATAIPFSSIPAYTCSSSGGTGGGTGGTGGGTGGTGGTGGSGGTGGGSGGSNCPGKPPTGVFRFKVYLPKGSCAKPTGITGYKGDFYVTWYCQEYANANPSSCGIQKGTSGTHEALNYYQDAGGYYTYIEVTANKPGLLCTNGGPVKIEWNFRPDMSSWPNSCNISGSSTIEFQGQVKNVTVSWP